LAADVGRTPPAVPSGLGARALPQSALGAQNGAAAAAARAPQRVPVAIQVSPDATQAMTPAQKADLAAVSALMEQRLFTWDQVTIALPGTIFDNSGKPIVSSGDLFKAPQANELERLAIKYGKLSQAQRDQLAKDGTFSVPSDDFPGQTHVWKAAELLQQGYERSRALLRSRLASSAEHYVNGLPRTISGGTALSLDRTLRNVGEGLHETAGLLYGMRETRRSQSEGSIEQRRREMLAAFMPTAVSGKDLSLYDLKLMEKAQPVLAKAQDKADEAWKGKAEAVAEELGKTIKDPQQLADAIAQARQQEIYTALTGNAELEAVREGLGALVIQRLKYMQAKQAILDEGTRDVRAYGDKARESLQKSNPILSLVSGWTEKKVSAAMAEYANKTRGRYEERLVKAAAELGLGEELSAESRFQKEFEPTRAAMLAETQANRAFSYDYQIWSRKNWTSEKSENGSYFGTQFRTVTRTTKDLAWRLSNLAQRALSFGNNLLYGLLVNTRAPIGGLVSGPLGWRALLSAAPFAYQYRLDSETGRWEATSARRNTYRSRLSGFYAQRRAILEAFNKKGRYSFFLGKAGERFIMFFTVDLGLGVIAPLVVGVMQPILTFANTAISLGLATATPFLIAPVVSAAVWAFQALVFDAAGTQYSRWRPSIKGSVGLVGLAALLGAAWYFGPKFGVDFFSGWWLAGVLAVTVAAGPLFPWVGTLVKKAGFYGAGATIVSVLKAVMHVVAGPALAIVSGALWAGRRLWDSLLMRPLLAWRAAVPGESGRFVKRIAGPGLTSEYFFQVSPDLPLVAAWASMESSELYRYQGDMKSLIAEPSKAYQEFAAVLDALTQGSNQGRNGSPAYKEIAEKESANEKALAEAVRPRADLYQRLLKVPQEGKIKLATPDLELLLKKTALLAERFYGKVMKDQAWSADKIAAFWKGRLLAANDWVGLGKQLQSSIVGEEILTPFEQTDKTLRIQVDAPGLEDYVKGLDAGIIPGQLDNVSVGDLGKPQSKPSVEPTVPVVRAADLGGGML
jgi:hypothetical protein